MTIGTEGAGEHVLCGCGTYEAAYRRGEALAIEMWAADCGMWGRAVSIAALAALSRLSARNRPGPLVTAENLELASTMAALAGAASLEDIVARIEAKEAELHG
jgi:hypothetical protein